MNERRKTTAVVMTVKNDAEGCAVTLTSILAQSRRPDEIIVVDGGSTDTTPQVLSRFLSKEPRLRVIAAPGVNIAQGRNIAVRSAASEIIACTDAGCRAEPDWLELLVAPIEQEPAVQFVAGFYRVKAHTLLEQVVGLATMRGQLEPVSPATFNPSARSMACTRELWARVGGWPEWLLFSEDTLFDHKVRRMGIGWRFVGEAIVHWRPRSTLRAVAKQFFHYGTGRGHTQIGAPDFLYNVRNATLLALVAALSFVVPWLAAVAAALFVYFYGWTFHRKAVKVARRTGRPVAYPLCILVIWVVLATNTLGYLVGSWQRFRRRPPYRELLEAYLATEHTVDPA